MDLGEGTLYILIVGCEVAFWVVLFSGLAARYVLQWGRISWFLLLCVPLIDLALLAFTVVDLNNGANATFAHGLATAYVRFTVAFGSPMIRWADQRFAHSFGGGPPPWKPPTHGWASVSYEAKLWAIRPKPSAGLSRRKALCSVDWGCSCCCSPLARSSSATRLIAPPRSRALSSWSSSGTE